MKTILITGASRGIGRATVVLSGAKGWSAGVNYAADAQAADEAVAAVRQAGGRAVTLKGDVSLEADVVSVFDAAQGHLGPLDGVMVNAGIVAPPLPFADMSADWLRRMFVVNILGAYLTAREDARRLDRDRGGRGGSIVLVSSAAARRGSPGEYVDYAGSKAALDTLAQLGQCRRGCRGWRAGFIELFRTTGLIRAET